MFFTFFNPYFDHDGNPHDRRTGLFASGSICNGS